MSVWFKIAATAALVGGATWVVGCLDSDAYRRVRGQIYAGALLAAIAIVIASAAAGVWSL